MKLASCSFVFRCSLLGALTLVAAGCVLTTARPEEQVAHLSAVDQRAEEIIEAMPPQRRQEVIQILGTDPVGRENRLMQTVDLFEQEGDDRTALQALMVGAELEFPEAEFRIGREFERAKMYGEAYGSLLKAARQGHLSAQYELGVMYADGRGVHRDVRQAIYWLQKASDAGLADASVKLKELQKSSSE